MTSNNIAMSSGKEGKIPDLRKELMKALKDWEQAPVKVKSSSEQKLQTSQELPQKKQLFNSIKEQLDKLSL